MKAGDLLQEGVVVRHDDKGVWVGREVSATETLTPGFTEHTVDGRRVFLANGQAPIPPAFLHPHRGKAKGKGK